MFATIFAERKKKLELRNSEIQKKAGELNKEVQALAKEYQANLVRLNLLTELEKEKDGKKGDLPK